jgi:hypothetical protein
MSTDAVATRLKRAPWTHPFLGGYATGSMELKGDYKAMQQNGVHELRLVVTTEDYDRALHFYRDVPGSRSGQRLLPQGGTSRSLRPAEQHWS